MRKSLFILFLLPVAVFAQRNMPLNREWGLNYEKVANYITPERVDSARLDNNYYGVNARVYQNENSCFKPAITNQFHQVKDKSRPWIVRKLKKESFIVVNDTAEKFHLTIDPLINFEFGVDAADKTHEKLYKNTRGFLARGDIGPKLSFESSFYENQSTFTKYMDAYIAGTNDLFPQTSNYNYAVIPGQGRSKVFKKTGYDYAMASGYVSYSPNKIFNIQVGHGKHFVGDGYRSLLLSDNAFNYPFARITTSYKNIQYTNLYTSFMNLTDGGVQTPPHVERLFQKKTGSFQMLSATFWKRLQLGLFQGMIWQASDSNNREHVNFNTFDPVIGVNTGIYGLHNTNNILWGATFKLRIVNTLSVYGQYMLDDISNANSGAAGNKSGYQVGIKYFDVFTIKNLHLQFEYNTVRPYSYAAGDAFQSYTHYNQALAHPLGSNFKEAIGFLNYSIKDFFIEIKANYAIKGNDSLNSNFGGNIFKESDVFSSSQNLEKAYTTQGMKSTIITKDIHVGYMLNRASNLNMVMGISFRTEQTYKSLSRTEFIYVGIRTSLANFYYDF